MNQNEMREAFEAYIVEKYDSKAAINGHLEYTKSTGCYHSDAEIHLMWCGWQEATAAAEAKYLPVIEKLVEALKRTNRAMNSLAEECRVDVVLHNICAYSALALAAPYLPAKTL